MKFLSRFDLSLWLILFAYHWFHRFLIINLRVLKYCSNHFLYRHVNLYLFHFFDQVMFAKNYQNNWDGHYVNKSNTLPSGASYYYQIDLDGNGSIEHEGWLYITK